MTVSDLRVLVDNLDEYIHIPGGIERLKKTVLHLAVSGQIVVQDPSEGTGEELYNKIQSVKTKLPKKQNSLLEIEASEIPYDIPDSWKWVRLGNVGLTVTGKTPSTNKHSLTEGKIPFVGPGNIAKNHILTGDYQKWLTEEASKSSEIARTNDILMVCIGGSIGKAALVDTPLCFNQQINKLSPIELEPRYVFTALISEYFQRLIIDSAVGGATPIINQTRWANLPLPLPPLDEQKRIVKRVYEIFALIDELDTKYKAEEAERSKLVKSSLRALSHSNSQLALDNLTSIIKTKADAAELRKAILHLAVSGKLVSQIPSEGTGEYLYKQIQAIKSQNPKKRNTLPEIKDREKPFAIPSSWRWTRVSDLGYALGQKVPDKEFYYIDVASINNSTQILKQPALLPAKDAPSRARKIVRDGTVIYSTVRPYLLNTTVVQDVFDKELIASTAFAILHPFAGIDSHWLLFNLTAQYFTDYTNEKSVGAAYPAINDAQFSMALMPLPPSAEQKRIVAKTTELLGLISELEKHMEK